MGCDISIYIEVKINDKWEHFNHPFIRRDYVLMNKICNATDRIPFNDNPIQLECKGIPNDISSVVKHMSDMFDYYKHHETYLNKDECKQLKNWLIEVYPPESDMGKHLFFEAMDIYCHSDLAMFEDFRFIIWFDN
jgi:hypothetical protein